MEIALILILILSAFALLLAQAGIFSVSTTVLLTVIIVSALYSTSGTFYKAIRRPLTIPKPNLELFSLILLLIFGILLFFKPYQYMDAGWDPGNYINTGIHIANKGSITYYDEFLSSSAQYLRGDGTGIKHPGLYIKDFHAGLVVPQFFYSFPVWIALFYKILGLSGSFYVNPFFAVCCAFLIFSIVKKHLGPGYALLAAFLLIFNTVEIWNSRFPTAEILGQFFILSGIYLWTCYLDTGEKLFCFWAGFSFGQFLLVNITSTLIIPMLAVYPLIRRNAKDIPFITAFGIHLILLAVQIKMFSFPYIESVLRFFKTQEIVFLISFGAILIILFSFFKKYILRILSALTPLFFVYAYFLRPHLGSGPGFLTAVELTQYLSFIGLAVCIAGLCIILYKENNEVLLLISITALFYAAFFIYDSKMALRYPFALRRYTPIVIPAYVICISYFIKTLNRLLKHCGKIISLLIILLVTILPLKNCRHALAANDNAGWAAFWAEFTKYMPEDGIYITNSYLWSRPLADIFGRNALNTENPVNFAIRMLTQREKVYYITTSPKPFSFDIDFKEVYQQALSFEYLEHSQKFPPAIRKGYLNFKIFRIMPLRKTADIKERECLISMSGDEIGIRGFDIPRHFSMGVYGRWTLGKAEIVIPWDNSAGIKRIVLQAQGMPEEAGISMVSIAVDGNLIVQNYFMDGQMHSYEIDIPAEISLPKNPLRATLLIESNIWCPNNIGLKDYPPQLGILIEWVKIEME